LRTHPENDLQLVVELVKRGDWWRRLVSGEWREGENVDALAGLSPFLARMLRTTAEGRVRQYRGGERGTRRAAYEPRPFHRRRCSSAKIVVSDCVEGVGWRGTHSWQCLPVVEHHLGEGLSSGSLTEESSESEGLGDGHVRLDGAGGGRRSSVLDGEESTNRVEDGIETHYMGVPGLCSSEKTCPRFLLRVE
jgi:hypothetical protein